MTHPDSPEFLTILERVPRWHMLTPSNLADAKELAIIDWDLHGYEIGHTLGGFAVGRRPIPENISRSMAWWELYNQLAEYSSTGAYFEYEEHDKSWPLSTCLDLKVTGLRKFGSRAHLKSLIPILGGESEIIKNLQEGPVAYMRWVLEN